MVENFIEDHRFALSAKTATLEHFANNVRTLGVHREVTDISCETLAEEELFLRGCHIVKKTLYWVGTLLVTADLDKLGADFF